MKMEEIGPKGARVPSAPFRSKGLHGLWFDCKDSGSTTVQNGISFGVQ